VNTKAQAMRGVRGSHQLGSLQDRLARGMALAGQDGRRGEFTKIFRRCHEASCLSRFFPRRRRVRSAAVELRDLPTDHQPHHPIMLDLAAL
jgi:hypothetical protein